MFKATYLETVADAGPAARSREAELFDRLIDGLEAVRGAPPTDRGRIEALRRVQELWRFLIHDLSDDANALPQRLRADLVSIGLWTIKEADSLIAGRKQDLGPLVEILSIVRGGLRDDAAGA